MRPSVQSGREASEDMVSRFGGLQLPAPLCCLEQAAKANASRLAGFLSRAIRIAAFVGQSFRDFCRGRCFYWESD
jgi:hypothetical protein